MDYLYLDAVTCKHLFIQLISTVPLHGRRDSRLSYREFISLYLCRLLYLTVTLYFTVTLAHLYVNGTYAHSGFMNQTRHSLQV